LSPPVVFLNFYIPHLSIKIQSRIEKKTKAKLKKAKKLLFWGFSSSFRKKKKIFLFALDHIHLASQKPPYLEIKRPQKAKNA